MRAQSWLRFVVVGAALWAGACGQANPARPSEVGSVVGSEDSAAVTTYAASVTLNPDQTASPSWVSVPAGSKVRFWNNTTRYRAVQSSNCSEFNLMTLAPGMAKTTMAFWPAGKTCDYWASDAGQMVFVGQVAVQ